MEWGPIVGVVVALAVAVFVHMVVIGRRNNDPLNRKCAAEICEYLTENASGSIEQYTIFEIFKKNARYKKQAIHISTMVPLLLQRVGIPNEVAKHAGKRVAEAALLLPE